MRIRSIPLAAVLVAVAALLLAPAAFAARSSSMSLNWAATQFTAPEPQPEARFGEIVAIDGNTAVSGVPQATVGQNMFQGAVHVYTRVRGVWQLEATLTADDGQFYDRFGTSVAIDNGMIAVGAPQAGGSGAVYVFTQAGGGWAQVAKLTPPDVPDQKSGAVGFGGMEFGQSVSLSGTILAVGAPYREQDGGVYVYAWDKDQGAFGLWATLIAGEPVTTGHHFGFKVDLDESAMDLRLAVTAPGQYDVEGAVYVFDTLSDVWTLQQKLVQPELVSAVGDPAPSSVYGYAVSLRGDVIAVGMPARAVRFAAGGDAAGTLLPPGAVYVYHYSDKWTNTGTLTASTPQEDDGFGSTVAVAGGLTVLVGAPGRTVGANVGQGAVFAYDWTGQIYLDSSELLASGGAAGDLLGLSLAVSEGQVLAGAPGATVDGNAGQGSMWLFVLPAPGVRVTGATHGWQDHPVRLTIKGEVTGGGAAIDSTQYRIGDEDWQTASQVTIRRQGVTTLYYRAVDVFGTLSATRKVVVRVDTKRPTVVAWAATAKTGTIVRMAYLVRDPEPSSGLAHVRVLVRDAAGEQVTRSATVPVTTNARHTVRIKARGLRPGVYTVYLRATDRAGNDQNGWSKATLTVKP
jgi:hypothetical protein